MIPGMDAHCRRLADSCRRDAFWLLAGSITAIPAVMFCVYASLPKMAITIAVLGAILGFIAATLRRDAAILEKLADKYEDTPH